MGLYATKYPVATNVYSRTTTSIRTLRSCGVAMASRLRFPKQCAERDLWDKAFYHPVAVHVSCTLAQLLPCTRCVAMGWHRQVGCLIDKQPHLIRTHKGDGLDGRIVANEVDSVLCAMHDIHHTYSTRSRERGREQVRDRFVSERSAFCVRDNEVDGVLCAVHDIDHT